MTGCCSGIPMKYDPSSDTELEDGVRELIYLMNLIPFVETTHSCEGHFETPYHRKPLDADAKEGMFYPGAVCFEISGEFSDVSDLKRVHFNNPDIEQFILRCQKLCEKYDFVRFAETRYSAELQKAGYTFRCWYDSKSPSRPILPRDIGQQRMRQTLEVWKEFESLCTEYLHEFYPSLHRP
jgi:hypothetical protein